MVKCPGVVARVLGSILGRGTCRTTSSGQELHSGMLSKRGGPVCPSQPDEKEPCHPKKISTLNCINNITILTSDNGDGATTEERGVKGEVFHAGHL